MQTTRQILQSHLTLIEWCEVIVNCDNDEIVDQPALFHSPHLELAALFIFDLTPQGEEYWWQIIERIKHQA